jgi:xanthine phosphoribosyltransferase
VCHAVQPIHGLEANQNINRGYHWLSHCFTHGQVFASSSRLRTKRTYFGHGRYLQAAYSSKTVGQDRSLYVSKSHISPTDRILVIDDLLSGGSSQEALFRIISDAVARAMGVGVLLEKVYDSGRRSLLGFDVPIHSLCRVASVSNGIIRLVEKEGYNQT